MHKTCAQGDKKDTELTGALLRADPLQRTHDAGEAGLSWSAAQRFCK